MVSSRIPVHLDTEAITDISTYLEDRREEEYRACELLDLSSYIFKSSRKVSRYSTVMYMVGLLRCCGDVGKVKVRVGNQLVTKYYYNK